MMFSSWINLRGDLFFSLLYSSFISSGFIYFVLVYTGCLCIWVHITLIQIVVISSMQSEGRYSLYLPGKVF